MALWKLRWYLTHQHIGYFDISECLSHFLSDFVNRNILDATVHTQVWQVQAHVTVSLMYSGKSRLTRHVICSCSVWELFTFLTSNCMFIAAAQNWNSECLKIPGKCVKVFSLFWDIFSAYKKRTCDLDLSQL